MPQSEGHHHAPNEAAARQSPQAAFEPEPGEVAPAVGRETILQAGRPSAPAQVSALAGLDSANRALTLTWLQQERGNAYVQRVVAELQRTPARTQPPTHNPQTLNRVADSPIIQRAPASPLTQAGQEAEATETLTRLQNAQREMLRSSNATLRNTAQLFVSRGGRPPRLQFSPMTLRSDSADLVRTRGDPAATTAYYFYGVTQNNEHRHGPNTVGTIEGDTILVRGRFANGNWRDRDDIMSTFAHEASHILVASYGEHPQTETDASSFDRYKDEFRAYWIEPVGPWARMAPNDDKARAIREHLVGASATDTRGYPDLRARYWNPAEAAFKAQVDNHRRPDGFNLTNNPNLDVLFRLLHGIAGGTSTVGDVLTHIVSRMSPAERTEAAASPLVQRLYRTLGDDTTRVENALRFPRTIEHARQLNPSNSPRITGFLEAVALQDSDMMKARYTAMTSAERGQVHLNPAVLVFIDRQITWQRQRASVYAMVTGGRVDQFDAMDEFLDACMDAQIEAALSGLTEVPARVRTALGRIVYMARLALYRMLEDIRRAYVDPLPNPVGRRLLYALREGGEP